MAGDGVPKGALFVLANWNDLTVKLFLSNYWRASLVPAAAVIPAPRVYTKVVAVKKLVVVFNYSLFFTFFSLHGE